MITKKYMGECYVCSRDIIIQALTNRKQNFNRLQLGDINKQCVAANGELLVLTPNLFKCIVCKSRKKIWKMLS